MKRVLIFLAGFFLMIGTVISGKSLIKQKTPSIIPSITASPTITVAINQQPTDIPTVSTQKIEEIEKAPEIEDISDIETDVDDLPDFNVEFSLE